MIQQYANNYENAYAQTNELKCYLCPGNKRAQGDTNPNYDNTFVFINDYSAVKEVQADYKVEESEDGMQIKFVL